MSTLSTVIHQADAKQGACLPFKIQLKLAAPCPANSTACGSLNSACTSLSVTGDVCSQGQICLQVPLSSHVAYLLHQTILDLEFKVLPFLQLKLLPSAFTWL